MLKYLSIRNYALIADVSIDLSPGLTVLTGETGAGKSILLGALGTILGERVDTTVLRTGTSKAVIEGIFCLEAGHPVFEFLTEHDLDAGDRQILIRREIHHTGRTRAFVNDTPVQLSLLQGLGDLLVDLHGQHEHQSLLKEENHLHFVDGFGQHEQELADVRECFAALTRSLNELGQLRQRRESLAAQRDLDVFHMAEIDKVDPDVDEDERLAQEATRIEHAERLFSLCEQCYAALYDSEGSVHDQLAQTSTWLNQLSEIDESFKKVLPDFDSVRVAVDDVASTVSSYRSKIDFSPERLDEIQNRRAQLTGLKKKLGRSLAEIIAYRKEIGNKTASFSTFESGVAEVTARVETERKKLSAACEALSSKRQEAVKVIEAVIPQLLEHLGMPGSRFTVELAYQDDPNGLVEIGGRSLRAAATGMDFAKFLISTNPGESLKPLRKVASGGEISRVMLGLKSTLATQGQIPVLVFDEIDNGVSGRIASAVGRKLLELSRGHQVLCITHLPQIACMGDTHYGVEKTSESGRTETRVTLLNVSERAEAIGKLLAGEQMTETHLKSAKELLQKAAGFGINNGGCKTNKDRVAQKQVGRDS